MRDENATRLSQMVHTFEETRGRILEAEKALAELRLTRRNEDGSIEVTVGAHRDVVDLFIADSALRHNSGKTLACSVLTLIGEAQEEAIRAAQTEYQRLSGLNLDPTALTGRDASDVLKHFSRELFGD